MTLVTYQSAIIWRKKKELGMIVLKILIFDFIFNQFSIWVVTLCSNFESETNQKKIKKKNEHIFYFYQTKTRKIRKEKEVSIWIIYADAIPFGNNN